MVPGVTSDQIHSEGGADTLIGGLGEDIYLSPI
jgi:hypothetical protein